MKTFKTIFFLMSANFILMSNVFSQCSGSIPTSIIRYELPKQDSNGLVVIAHGLNLRPEKMNSLADFFLSQNFTIANIALLGHKTNDENQWGHLNISSWKREMTELGEWLTKCHQSWIGVGQSTGAVMLYWMAQQKVSPPPQQFYFFAPAFIPKYPLGILSWLANWFPTFKIPSANLEDYRVHDGTTLSAYRTLYLTSKETAPKEDLLNIMNIIVSDEDELLSVEDTKSWAKLPEQQWWTYKPIAQDQKTIHHLMIDSKTMGHEAWESLLSRLTTDLKILKPNLLK